MDEILILLIAWGTVVTFKNHLYSRYDEVIAWLKSLDHI